MNRILVALHECQCERRRRRLAAAQRVADEVHQLIGDFVEVSFRPRAEDADNKLYFWFGADAELQPTDDYPGAITHLATELRIMAEQCETAADVLEGGDQ